MMASANSAPVPVADDPIHQDLICSICMGLPSDIPVITPCQHLFCRACLHEALSHQQLCPVDRCAVAPHQVTALQEGSLVRRIWSSIRVKCGNHTNGCAWVGNIGDYGNHASSCEHNGQNASSHQLREALRYIDELTTSNSRLTEDLDEARRQIQLKDAAFRELAKLIIEHDPRTIGLFNDNYNFGRFDVVPLSQLIAARLENKPDYIESNKIFNCVQTCYRDWNAGYKDNPEHYTMDMKMLLAICNASTWFSDNQRNQLREMLSKF